MGGPFTPEELSLIELANEAASFLGHHGHHGHGHGHGHDHHHGDAHKQYKPVQKLTTNLGLYSLKKLNTINPTFLKARQARLLDPVTPGPISYLINIGFYVMAGTYATYLWRTRGFRGFASVAVVPFVLLAVGRPLTNEAVSYIRQYNFYFQRKALVDDYVAKYGQKFLLDALNSSFRL